MRDADIAMYRAKARGKARYEIFDRQMYDETIRLIELENNLRLAVERQEFLLHYQPIISLQSDRLVGFEALIRWQHPDKGLISPVDFIPIAEDTSLILNIGEWLLEEACQQLQQWQQKYADSQQVTSLKMSINLACQQLQDPLFIEKLDRILRETGVDGSSLRLEITESALIEPGGGVRAHVQHPPLRRGSGSCPRAAQRGVDGRRGHDRAHRTGGNLFPAAPTRSRRGRRGAAAARGLAPPPSPRGTRRAPVEEGSA